MINYRLGGKVSKVMKIVYIREGGRLRAETYGTYSTLHANLDIFIALKTITHMEQNGVK